MKIGLIFGSFAGGGAERMMINLAKGLHKKSYKVTIYIVNKEGPYLDDVPSYINIHNYNAKKGVKSILYKIRRTLKEDKLSTVISTQAHINAAIGFASIGLKRCPKLIFREANTPSLRNKSILKHKILSLGYKQADHYIAISKGLKDNMANYYNLKQNNIDVIFNPVIDETIRPLSKEKPNHPWLLDSKVPVVVGMGRLVPQKDFFTLIKAFKVINNKIECRLIIFGKSYSVGYTNSLKSYVRELKLDECVDLPGFSNNPFSILSHADIFVQTPIYEGFGNILVEALACGCPVVSTDCPFGPSEILQNGEYGKLVTIGDYYAIAGAILETLRNPPSRQKLRDRASSFSIEKSIESYIKIMQI